MLSGDTFSARYTTNASQSLVAAEDRELTRQTPMFHVVNKLRRALLRDQYECNVQVRFRPHTSLYFLVVPSL